MDKQHKSSAQDLAQLLKDNNIDPAHFDLAGFDLDRRNFGSALQSIRERHQNLELEPVWSLHQVHNGGAR